MMHEENLVIVNREREDIVKNVLELMDGHPGRSSLKPSEIAKKNPLVSGGAGAGGADSGYVKWMAKAQKLTDLQSMLRGFEVMMQVAEIAPVMDYLDADKLVQYLVEVTGIPARVIRSDDEVARIRRQAQQAQAQQAQQQQAMMESEQAKNVAPLIKAVGGLGGAA
jgi:hypothetical protein